MLYMRKVFLGWIPGLSTYDFAHAKVKKSIFSLKILEFVGDIDIILNEFQSWFNSTIKIRIRIPE